MLPKNCWAAEFHPGITVCSGAVVKVPRLFFCLMSVKYLMREKKGWFGKGLEAVVGV